MFLVRHPRLWISYSYFYYTAEMDNPLLKIQEFGQSIWLDYIRRSMITSGELKRLIEKDGLRGGNLQPFEDDPPRIFSVI
jgi:hypothetical protein